jgi:polysaccharide biosynthesis/export protein
MSFRTIVAVFLLLFQAACSSVGSLAPVPPNQASAYQLGPGDEVRVVVNGFDAMNNNYVVGDDGTISLPMLGPVPIGNRSAPEAERLIANQLVQGQLAVNPSVSVQILKYRPFFILGEVQKPGQYPYVPGMSVLTAVSIAGGHTFRANKKTYGISRNVSGRAIKGKASETTPVQPGDTVIVYEAWF